MPEVGQAVVVVRGEYAGNIAKIKSIAEKTATLIVDGKTTGNIKFEQFVSEGDTVQSTGGKYHGKVGTIKSIAEKTLKLVIDGEETGNLKPDSIGKHDGADMVAPGTPEKASAKKGDVETPEKAKAPNSTASEGGYAKEFVPTAPSANDSETLQVGEKVVVVRGEYAGHIAKINAIAEKTATLIVDGKTTGNIKFEQFCREGDTVKSTSGKYDGKVGTIKSIAEKTLKLVVDGEETGNLKPDSIGKD